VKQNQFFGKFKPEARRQIIATLNYGFHGQKDTPRGNWERCKKKILISGEAVKRDVQPGSEEMEHESPATRHYWANWKLLELKDGVLFRKYTRKDGTGTFQQFIAPAKLHSEILDQMHNSVLSGHLAR
jgi:hypothetical protein